VNHDGRVTRAVRVRRQNSSNARWITVFIVLLAGRCAQAVDDFPEYQLKAAFLLNFIKFIDWPASAFADPVSPVAICILGDDPFGNALDQVVEGETVNGRKVTAQRIKRAPQAKTCQVVFLMKPENDMVRTLGSGILTVGQGESFIHDGGMIAFVIENRRIGFVINQGAAEAAGLKLSSKLMRVARTVQK